MGIATAPDNRNRLAQVLRNGGEPAQRPASPAASVLGGLFGMGAKSPMQPPRRAAFSMGQAQSGESPAMGAPISAPAPPQTSPVNPAPPGGTNGIVWPDTQHGGPSAPTQPSPSQLAPPPPPAAGPINPYPPGSAAANWWQSVQAKAGG